MHNRVHSIREALRSLAAAEEPEPAKPIFGVMTGGVLFNTLNTINTASLYVPVKPRNPHPNYAGFDVQGQSVYVDAKGFLTIVPPPTGTASTSAP